MHKVLLIGVNPVLILSRLLSDHVGEVIVVNEPTTPREEIHYISAKDIVLTEPLYFEEDKQPIYNKYKNNLNSPATLDKRDLNKAKFVKRIRNK